MLLFEGFSFSKRYLVWCFWVWVFGIDLSKSGTFSNVTYRFSKEPLGLCGLGAFRACLSCFFFWLTS